MPYLTVTASGTLVSGALLLGVSDLGTALSSPTLDQILLFSLWFSHQTAYLGWDHKVGHALVFLWFFLASSFTSRTDQ